LIQIWTQLMDHVPNMHTTTP